MPTQARPVRVPDGLWSRLEEIARQQGVTPSDVARFAFSYFADAYDAGEVAGDLARPTIG